MHLVGRQVSRVLIVGVIVWDLVDVAKHRICTDGHLHHIERVDTHRLRKHDRALSVGAPPCGVVHDVLLDDTVITTVDTDRRVWCMVHYVVMDMDVVATPHDNATS